MSFDLWAWRGPAYTLATINLGIARFEAGDEEAFVASRRVAGFRDALLARFPIEAAPRTNGHTPDSARAPWATAPASSDRLVVMNLSWTVRDDQLDAILRLVDDFDLWLYDPQRALVQPPASQRGESAWRRLARRLGLR